MKKKVLVVAIVTGMLSITSCSQDENLIQTEHQTVNQIENYAVLNQQLTDLNAETFGTTRGWLGKFFKKVCAVIVCDAVGGLCGSLHGGVIGGIAGATVCSAAAVICPVDQITLFAKGGNLTRAASIDSEVVQLPIQSREVALNGVVIRTKEEPTLADSVGYYHNLIVLNSDEHKTLTSRDVHVLAKDIYIESAKTFKVPEDELLSALDDSPEMNTYLNEKLYSQKEDETLNEYCVRLKKFYPDLSKDIDVFETIMTGITNLEGVEECEYVENVIEIINRSSISEIDKERLRNAAVIGFASSKLWDIKEESK